MFLFSNRIYVTIPALTSLLISSAVAAADLSAPQGEVVLTVSGEITHTNVDDTAQFDLDMLRVLPSEVYETTTIWTEGDQVFKGVPLLDLLESVGATGTQIRATAVNDYAIDFPISDMAPTRPLVAYENNGREMSLRDKGPLWIVFPFDSGSQYQTEVIFSRSIWQLDRLEVVSE